jgi:hypothetical protein
MLVTGDGVQHMVLYGVLLNILIDCQVKPLYP